MTDTGSPLYPWPPGAPDAQPSPWAPPVGGGPPPRGVNPVILTVCIVVALIAGGVIGAVARESAANDQHRRVIAAEQEVARQRSRIASLEDTVAKQARTNRSCQKALDTAASLFNLSRQSTAVVSDGFTAIGNTNFERLQTETVKLQRLTLRMTALMPRLDAQEAACSG